jgi:hypothetical protein
MLSFLRRQFHVNAKKIRARTLSGCNFFATHFIGRCWGGRNLEPSVVNPPRLEEKRQSPRHRLYRAAKVEFGVKVVWRRGYEVGARFVRVVRSGFALQN